MESLVDYFHRVAGYPWWVVAIELFLIGLVVYWAVDFLEGTRGERLFRGVIFILIAGLLVLNLMVERLEFLRLQYLYKGFALAVVIIAVAAFQPEIRRALIRIGQPGFLAGSEKIAGTVQQIVHAITEMSAARCGAIIVVERHVALGEFIETGVRVDARVTSELLRTIFHKGSALHDMAVVIRSDRIVAARVQLPLAEAGSIDGVELGSRHRAAIGITEGSDAACIVVSEETSGVSIAENGKLTRNISEAQLKQRLTRLLTETKRYDFAGAFERLKGRHQQTDDKK
jgi:diadenylate cyclase